MYERVLSSSIVRFAAVGIINTAVGLGGIFALKFYLGFADEVANLCGYLMGFAVSCVLNSRWTFRSAAPLLHIAPRYALVVLVAYLANLLFVMVSIRTFGANDYLSHALGVLPYAVVTYVLSRIFVFGSQGEHRR